VKVLEVIDFIDWKSECFIFKLNKQITHLLNTIVHIRAESGLKYLLNSCKYDENTQFRMFD